MGVNGRKHWDDHNRQHQDAERGNGIERSLLIAYGVTLVAALVFTVSSAN
jgi:hypothetical protein